MLGMRVAHPNGDSSPISGTIWPQQDSFPAAKARTFQPSGHTGESCTFMFAFADAT
jgi:hypothetical protein